MRTDNDFEKRLSAVEAEYSLRDRADGRRRNKWVKLAAGALAVTAIIVMFTGPVCPILLAHIPGIGAVCLLKVFDDEWFTRDLKFTMGLVLMMGTSALVRLFMPL